MSQLQSGWIKGLSVGAALLFGSTVMINEGLPTSNSNGNYEPYKDPIGITTICFGYVPQKNEAIKKEYTLKDCKVLLDKTVEQYSVVLKGLPALPLSTVVGFLDFGYNAGISAANGSGIKKALMKQDLKLASQEVLKWRFVSKSTLSKSDLVKGKWEWDNSKNKYRYDCSQLVNGKPNKVCYGLYTRRLMESELISGKITSQEEIQKYINKMK